MQLKQGVILISFMCIYVCQCGCTFIQLFWIPEEDVETPGAKVSCESPNWILGTKFRLSVDTILTAEPSLYHQIGTLPGLNFPIRK